VATARVATTSIRLRHEPRDCRQQDVDLNRLDQVEVKPGIAGSRTVFLAAVACDGDDGGRPEGGFGSKPPNDLVAIQNREPQIEEYDARVKLRRDLEGITAIRRSHHLETGNSEQTGKGLNNIGMIVNHEYADPLTRLVLLLMQIAV